MKGLHLELFCRKLSCTILVSILISSYLSAQTIIVTDTANNPLAGVLVYNENINFTGKTGKNGSILLPDSMKSVELNFYLFGFKTAKINTGTIFKNGGIVILQPISHSLQDIIIVGRNEQYLQDIISETSIISQKDIEVTQSQTTADALMMSGNVFVQKTQFGGGSPVLRGFEANRVLLVLDGIRMNNAIYRNGHLQNTITVDNFALKRIEVLFGPGSLTYGSDAIGGVIHFKTKDPVFNTQYADYKLRYSSAAREKTGFIGINYGKKNFANLFIFSKSSFGDLISGSNRPAKYPDFGKREYYVKTIDGIDTIVKNSNPDKQIGTGYSQYNVLNKSLFRLKKNALLTFNLQFSNTGNIPRYDFLTEEKNGHFKYAEWYYGPQKRFLSSMRLDFSNVNLMYDNAVLIAAIQKINEDRIYRKYKKKWKNYNMERLWVSSLSADFKKYINHNRNHELVYGVDFQYNDLTSSAKRVNINTGETDFDILTRYPSGLAINYRTGGYLQYVFGEEDYPYQLSFGYRVEKNDINIRYERSDPVKWPEEYINGLHNKNTSHAFSTGIKYDFGYDYDISANLSSAFRNPNIDDLAKIRVKKGEMLVPNLNLKTENSYNFEYSLSKGFRKDNNFIKIKATAYFTKLYNVIVRDMFVLPDGSSLYIDGNDTLQVVANQNDKSEEVLGLSFMVKGKYKNFDFSYSFVYTDGNIVRNVYDISPAPHIPPVFGNAKLSYHYKKIDFDFILLYNGKKPLKEYGGSVDNPENATEDGTYAWTTYNIYLTYKWKKIINVNLGIENILDLHYRPFASGVSAAGRNIIVGVSGKI